jgi:RNA polymerase sigma factor (sigma-70 family)
LNRRGAAPTPGREPDDFQRDHTAYSQQTAASAGSFLSVRRWLASPYLQRLAWRIAHQYHLSNEDVPVLIQELRLALWKAGPAAQVNLRWIAQTASHKAVDFLRRRMRDPLPMPEDIDLPGGKEDRAELLCLLHTRVARLPVRLRRFYRLRYQQGLSQREIAAKQGICRASVRCLDNQCVRWLASRALPPAN